MNNSPAVVYRIAGNFSGGGGANFLYFRDYPASHEIFHPRIFSRLLRIGLRESRNLKPRKLILKTPDSFSRKFAPPKITRYTVCMYVWGLCNKNVHSGGQYSRPSIVRPPLYPAKLGLSKEVVCHERWADMYGKCIRASYFWFITRGGLW